MSNFKWKYIGQILLLLLSSSLSSKSLDYITIKHCGPGHTNCLEAYVVNASISPAVVDFLDQDYKSVSTQILHDAGLASVLPLGD